MNEVNRCLVAVLVTYFPTDNQIENIKTISKKLNYLFVVDNSENLVDKLSTVDHSIDNIKLLLNYNIGGIAGALNLGVNEAIEMFSDCFIYLLDQDSIVENEFFEKQYLFARNNGRRVVAPKYFDINSHTFGNYTKLSKWRFENIMGHKITQPVESTFAITSGTLIHSSIFMEIGYFRNDYFIDHVDSEFCIRLHRSGYLILINPDVVFKHAIGERVHRKFMGISFKPNFHSPLRRYYSVRNGVLMVKQHFRFFPSVLLLIFVRISYEFMGIFLYEPFKMMKFKALLWGLCDGFTGKSGRCGRKFS